MKEEEKMQKIGVVGYGNMSSAIIRRLLAQGYPPKAIVVANPTLDKPSMKELKKLGVEITSDNKKAAAGADRVLLGVKPKNIVTVARQISGVLKPEAIVDSLAAIVDLDIVQRALGPDVKAECVMSNLGAEVGEATTAICLGNKMTRANKEESVGFYKKHGAVSLQKNPKMMNAETVVKGCGTAYPAYFIREMARQASPYLSEEQALREAQQSFQQYFELRTPHNGSACYPAQVVKKLEQACISLGWSEEQARKDIEQLFRGYFELVKKTGEFPDQVIKRVATPGGVTARVIDRLEAGDSLAHAFAAGLTHAEGLGQTISDALNKELDQQQAVDASVPASIPALPALGSGVKYLEGVMHDAVSQGVNGSQQNLSDLSGSSIHSLKPLVASSLHKHGSSESLLGGRDFHSRSFSGLAGGASKFGVFAQPRPLAVAPAHRSAPVASATQKLAQAVGDAAVKVVRSLAR
ncbi:MAG: pyrroline-5-carboxylate reductase [Gammaproteobacteria bacterium]|nr:pyrroline-5-carboxylate reductase [Gammaproteobacteria bacterium]